MERAYSRRRCVFFLGFSVFLFSFSFFLSYDVSYRLAWPAGVGLGFAGGERGEKRVVPGIAAALRS